VPRAFEVLVGGVVVDSARVPRAFEVLVGGVVVDSARVPRAFEVVGLLFAAGRVEPYRPPGTLFRPHHDQPAMYEVELKVPADHDAVRERLAAVGAERVGAVEQVDTYYGAPHRSFVDTDEALRVRAEHPDDGEPVHELTYKGPKVDDASKTREEHESTVGDPDAVDAALRALGFEPAATVEKHRERYRVDDVTVTLDDVDGVGSYVEVERAASEAAVEAAREDAVAVLRDLGLDPDDQVRTSYLGLALGVDEE
jgi:adenylate cyclase class 2